MTQRTCDMPDCNNAHRARGLCATHYNQQHQPNGHPKYQITCETCGKVWMTPRNDGRFCSLLCRDIWRGARMVWPLPVHHPVMLILHPPPPPVVKPTFERECEWCGAGFTTTKRLQRMCSHWCKRKALDVRRRGRQAGSFSHYTWAEVIRVHLAFDKRCPYCEQPIIGQPDPDHVVPLSKGGSNSITNILPCCHSCNSSKRDLSLEEWALDRERRGLPVPVTQWAPDDLRVRHLTSLTAVAI